jgi:hypothetical protein
MNFFIPPHLLLQLIIPALAGIGVFAMQVVQVRAKYVLSSAFFLLSF